jgi:hypothetical protein
MNAFVCVHVYMCVCIYVYMHACAYICTYVWLYVCMHACMNVCVHACMKVCLYACMCLCMYDRYQKSKTDWLRFVMCPLLVPVFQGFFFFLWWPLTVIMNQTRQYVPLSSQYYLYVYGMYIVIVVADFNILSCHCFEEGERERDRCISKLDEKACPKKLVLL